MLLHPSLALRLKIISKKTVNIFVKKSQNCIFRLLVGVAGKISRVSRQFSSEFQVIWRKLLKIFQNIKFFNAFLTFVIKLLFW